MARKGEECSCDQTGQKNTEFLTDNGRKFVIKQLIILEKNRKELLGQTNTDGEHGRVFDEAERSIGDQLTVIEQQITDFKKKLRLPRKEVKEQKTFFLPGNGGKVRINGNDHTTHIVLDGVCVCKHKLPPNHLIAAANSPIGMALYGKKVGDNFEYQANGSLKTGTVLEIHPPSKSKWIFKCDQYQGQEVSSVVEKVETP